MTTTAFKPLRRPDARSWPALAECCLLRHLPAQREQVSRLQLAGAKRRLHRAAAVSSRCSTAATEQRVDRHRVVRRPLRRCSSHTVYKSYRWSTSSAGNFVAHAFARRPDRTDLKGLDASRDRDN